MTYKRSSMIVFLAFLSLPLASCSMLGALNPVGGGPTVGLEATLGDKDEAVVGQVGSTQEIQVESLSGGLTTNNTTDVPIEFMVLMILGWLLPSPQEIWAGFTKFLHGFRGNTSG